MVDRLRERAMSSHTNAEMFTTHLPRAMPSREKVPDRSSAGWMASNKSFFLYSLAFSVLGLSSRTPPLVRNYSSDGNRWQWVGAHSTRLCEPFMTGMPRFIAWEVAHCKTVSHTTL